MIDTMQLETKWVIKRPLGMKIEIRFQRYVIWLATYEAINNLKVYYIVLDA